MNVFRAVLVCFLFSPILFLIIELSSDGRKYGELRPFSPPPESEEQKRDRMIREYERSQDPLGFRNVLSEHEQNLAARAQRGDVEAALELGEWLEFFGRPQEALPYYLDAVEGGSDLALFRLAWLIEWGQIKTSDDWPSSYFIAYLLNTVSAKKGNSWAFWSAQRQQLFLTSSELEEVETEIHSLELLIAKSSKGVRSKETSGGK